MNKDEFREALKELHRVDYVVFDENEYYEVVKKAKKGAKILYYEKGEENDGI